MTNRVAGFILGNRRVGREAHAEMPELRIRPGVKRIAIVGINDVASRTARGAVITRLIVRAQERQQRVEQAGLLQSLKHRVRARQGAEAAIAQPSVPAFENTQRVAGLRRFEVRQRIEKRQQALGALLFGRNRRPADQPSRRSVGGVTFSETGIL